MLGRIRRRRAREERGAIAILTGVMMVVLTLSAAFAVDLGQQRVAQRDMQALADVVALDMARQLDGRNKGAIQGSAQWNNHLADSLARNDDTFGATPHVALELGTVSVTGAFVPSLVSTDIPTAVRAAAASTVDYLFTKNGGGEGDVRATAVAVADRVACFGLGSYALKLDSDNSALLNGLIGDALNLSAVGYTGLADAKVDLLSVGTELGAGTVDELMDLDHLQVGDFYVAMAAVLRSGGHTADADLLEYVALHLGAIPTIDFADLVELGSAEEASLSTEMNVLDLVAGAAFLSNGTNFLSVPNLGVDLGITNVNASLKLIEGVKVACGKRISTRADTSQVDLDVKGDLVGTPSVLGLQVSAKMDLQVDLASGTGKLMEVYCGNNTVGNPDGVDVQVNSALTSLTLRMPIVVKGLLGLPILEFEAVATKTPPTAESSVLIRVPPATYDTPHSAGGGELALSGTAIQTVNVRVLGLLPLPAGDIIAAVLNTVVVPTMATIDTQLLEPLADLLGVNIAGVDVFGHRRPECGIPALRG